MRVYQFRQFRIGHELLLCHKFANLSSVLGNLFFFWAAPTYQIRWHGYYSSLSSGDSVSEASRVV